MPEEKIKTALITENFNGQSIVSADIQNGLEPNQSPVLIWRKIWKSMPGRRILKLWKEIRLKELKKYGQFLFLWGREKLETMTILVASGSRRRKLDVPGEKEFDGKGVVYCATCDVPLFNKKTVAVVGAGNAGLEAVRDLISYASKIYLLVRAKRLRRHRNF